MVLGRLVYLTVLSITHVLLVNSLDSNQCKDGKRPEKVPDFNRVFSITYDGAPASLGSREDFKRLLGSCSDLNEFTNGMFEFFSSFGFNMSHPTLRQNPFSFFASPEYNLTNGILDDASNRAILGSFYEFGEYMDSQIFTATWKLITNIEMNLTGRHPFPKGTAISHGHLRMKFHGLDKCIIYKSSVPSWLTNNGYYLYGPVDLTLYSKDWGEGSAQGLVKIHLNANKPRCEARMIATFPATRQDQNDD